VEDIKKFFQEKANEDELYDLKFSERLHSFYIERFTNNLSYFSLSISKIFYLFQIHKRKILENYIKKNSFIIKFIEQTGFKDFDFDRLVQLEKILKKNKPKIIFEFGSGLSTIWMSNIINKHNLNCKIFSFDNNKSYLDKISKNIDYNISKNITFCLRELELFKYKNRKFVRYNNILPLDNVDLLYIDGPVMYDYKKYDDIKFIKSGDIIHCLINELSLPKMILTDGKYDLYPVIKKFKKFKTSFDRVHRSLIYTKVND
jgi:hypothetical protein